MSDDESTQALNELDPPQYYQLISNCKAAIANYLDDNSANINMRQVNKQLLRCRNFINENQKYNKVIIEKEQEKRVSCVRLYRKLILEIVGQGKPSRDCDTICIADSSDLPSVDALQYCVQKMSTLVFAKTNQRNKIFAIREQRRKEIELLTEQTARMASVTFTYQPPQQAMKDISIKTNYLRTEMAIWTHMLKILEADEVVRKNKEENLKTQMKKMCQVIGAIITIRKLQVAQDAAIKQTMKSLATTTTTIEQKIIDGKEELRNLRRCFYETLQFKEKNVMTVGIAPHLQKNTEILTVEPFQYPIHITTPTEVFSLNYDKDQLESELSVLDESGYYIYTICQCLNYFETKKKKKDSTDDQWKKELMRMFSRTELLKQAWYNNRFEAQKAFDINQMQMTWRTSNMINFNEYSNYKEVDVIINQANNCVRSINVEDMDKLIFHLENYEQFLMKMKTQLLIAMNKITMTLQLVDYGKKVVKLTDPSNKWCTLGIRNDRYIINNVVHRKFMPDILAIIDALVDQSKSTLPISPEMCEQFWEYIKNKNQVRIVNENRDCTILPTLGALACNRPPFQYRYVMTRREQKKESLVIIAKTPYILNVQSKIELRSHATLIAAHMKMNGPIVLMKREYKCPVQEFDKIIRPLDCPKIAYRDEVDESIYYAEATKEILFDDLLPFVDMLTPAVYKDKPFINMELTQLVSEIKTNMGSNRADSMSSFSRRKGSPDLSNARIMTTDEFALPESPAGIEEPNKEPSVRSEHSKEEGGEEAKGEEEHQDQEPETVPLDAEPVQVKLDTVEEVEAKEIIIDEPPESFTSNVTHMEKVIAVQQLVDIRGGFEHKSIKPEEPPPPYDQYHVDFTLMTSILDNLKQHLKEQYIHSVSRQITKVKNLRPVNRLLELLILMKISDIKQACKLSGPAQQSIFDVKQLIPVDLTDIDKKFLALQESKSQAVTASDKKKLLKELECVIQSISPPKSSAPKALKIETQATSPKPVVKVSTLKEDVDRMWVTYPENTEVILRAKTLIEDLDAWCRENIETEYECKGVIISSEEIEEEENQKKKEFLLRFKEIVEEISIPTITKLDTFDLEEFEKKEQERLEAEQSGQHKTGKSTVKIALKTSPEKKRISDEVPSDTFEPQIILEVPPDKKEVLRDKLFGAHEEEEGPAPPEEPSTSKEEEPISPDESLKWELLLPIEPTPLPATYHYVDDLFRQRRFHNKYFTLLFSECPPKLFSAKRKLQKQCEICKNFAITQRVACIQQTGDNAYEKALDENLSLLIQCLLHRS